MRKLLNLFSVLWAALVGIASSDSPPVPRYIKHNLHPAMKRGYGKVVGGGNAGAMSLAGVLQVAFTVAVLVGGFVLMSKVMALSGIAGVSLAMPSLMTRALELKEERANVFGEARTILDKAEAEKRTLTTDEQTEYDRRFAKAEELRISAETYERQHNAEIGLEQRSEAGREQPPKDEQKTGARTYRPESTNERAVRRSYVLTASTEVEKREMDNLGKYLRTGRMTEEQQQRAMQADNDIEGGFVKTPQKFLADLIQAVDDFLFLRQFATVIQVPDADSLGRPSLDTDLADADWTTELATGSLDETMRFGKRELKPHPMAKLTKISRTLIRKQAIDVVGKVKERLAYKFGVTQEKGFLTGNGVQRPLGLFTASNDGISTARDVSTGNTGTSVTFDGLKEAKWSLKPQYHAAARWVAHRDFAKQVDKLKDGEGRYIWQQSVLAGAPDTVLNFPLHLSEFAPNTFTTGQYVAVLGDMSFYHIAEALGLDVQTLMELYAATNQVGYIGRVEVDGMPVLGEAFARVKLG